MVRRLNRQSLRQELSRNVRPGMISPWRSENVSLQYTEGFKVVLVFFFLSDFFFPRCNVLYYLMKSFWHM